MVIRIRCAKETLPPVSRSAALYGAVDGQGKITVVERRGELREAVE